MHANIIIQNRKTFPNRNMPVQINKQTIIKTAEQKFHVGISYNS